MPPERRLVQRQLLLLLLLLLLLSHATSQQQKQQRHHQRNKHQHHQQLQQPQLQSKYPGCRGVPQDWLPECWVAAHARLLMGDDRVAYWTPHTSRRWGNVLSPYWQSRALAQLAGHGFSAYVGFDRFWLQYLPKELPPTGCPDLAAFEEACNQCDSESWAYPHRCAGAWTRIRPTIVNDTQAAFAAWAAAKGFALPTFQPSDVVIQSRCSKDTLLAHPEHGPAGFSFYTAISPATRAISLVADLAGRDPLCARIHDAQLAWLRRKYPAANVTLIGGGMHAAFARLLLAPVVFKDAQSSFGLWAALANRGQVWSLPLLAAFTNDTQPHLGEGWHWSSAPVLYPHVAAAAGITLQRPDAIIEWLETH